MMDRLVHVLLFVALISAIPASAAVPIRLADQFVLPDSISVYGKLSMVDFDQDGNKEFVIVNGWQAVAYSFQERRVVDYLLLKPVSGRRQYVAGSFDHDHHLDLVEFLIDTNIVPQHLLAIKWLSQDGYTGSDTVVLGTMTSGGPRSLQSLFTADAGISHPTVIYGSTYFETQTCWPHEPCVTYRYTDLFSFDADNDSVKTLAKFPTQATERLPGSSGEDSILIDFQSYSSVLTPPGSNIYRDAWFSVVEYRADSAIFGQTFRVLEGCSLVGNWGEVDNYALLRSHMTGRFVSGQPGSQLLLSVEDHGWATGGCQPSCCNKLAFRLDCYSLYPIGSMSLLWSSRIWMDSLELHPFSEPNDPGSFYCYARPGTIDGRFYKRSGSNGSVQDSSSAFPYPGEWLKYTELSASGPRFALYVNARTLNLFELVVPTGVDDDQDKPLPGDFVLKSPYPNPFNGELTISLSMPRRQQLSVEILNVRGQVVTEVFDGIAQEGNLQLAWRSDHVSSGIYFVRVTGDHQAKTAKVVLLK
jgi:hypothetical protein